ncbi:pyrroline-5-carboxylate reductase [Actinophytocola sediminis]
MDFSGWRVVLIGAGHMGTAIIAGLVKNGGDLPLVVIEKAESRRAEVRAEFGVEAREQYEPGPADVVVIAVQPQQFAAFAGTRSPGDFDNALVVSVMAGVTISAMTALLGTERVVRSIPNTPCEVAEGMTVLVAGSAVTSADLVLAERMLAVLGRVLTVADEALVDEATALCGGGPAFVAHIAGAFAEFAVAAGFQPGQARLMTCQVLRGTAALLESTTRSPEELCDEVMTPGGTTEQGILHYRENRLREILIEGLNRAAERSRELDGLVS